jgi:hypothetical protein
MIVGHLAREPVLRGIWGDLEMNNPPRKSSIWEQGERDPPALPSASPSLTRRPSFPRREPYGRLVSPMSISAWVSPCEKTI